MEFLEFLNMDLFRKFSKLILLVLIFHSAAAASATKPTTSVWEKSYTLESQKKYAEAANVIKPALDKAPKDELALIRMGWLNYLLAKYNESAEYYHKALDVNADSIDARLGLTLPLLAEQRWKEAALYANQVISINAWSYLAHTRLMISESGLAQWEVLEKHASEFIKRYPSDVSGFLFLARAQAMLGKKQQATQNYEKTLERAPTNMEAIKYLEGK
jgi:tetratricopeptide (TPR) repeat protein